MGLFYDECPWTIHRAMGQFVGFWHHCRQASIIFDCWILLTYKQGEFSSSLKIIE